mgnify:CR=1 FL=1
MGQSRYSLGICDRTGVRYKLKPTDDQSIHGARPDVAETATNNTSFENLYTHTAGTRS